MKEADYVVVGAGSAGCVVASRLSDDGSKVVLLEAGPPDRHPMIHVPAGILSLLYNPKVNWCFSTEPDEGSGQRRIHWPRGRVLGGSSSINGMLYVRGNPADYDNWAQRGCRGWSYDDVLPFFKKSEHYADGTENFRGRGGPLIVEDYRTTLPLTDHFVTAAQQAGHPLTPDYNGSQQEGVAYSQMTRRGRFRASTARTFLREARGRANLEIVTGAVAAKLNFEGKRCTGVTYLQGDQTKIVTANREVIVCGGAVNSPHLLQISGIGSGEHLKSIGVGVVQDLPGVGGNLSDHYVARVSHRVRNNVSINELSRGPRLIREALRWVFRGDGALTFGVTSAMVFCRSREGLASPDLQLLFTPASYDEQRFGKLEREPGITVAVCPIRPESRGTIMATTSDPKAAPAIVPNYLSAESDVQVLISGFRKTRDIFTQAALKECSLGETVPGPDVQTDEEIEAFAREAGNTIYHPVGTCRMGEDSLAVVDSRLRVKGIAGLRVADASIMPEVTSGNTNAPTIMIGEKCAALIKEDARHAS